MSGGDLRLVEDRPTNAKNKPRLRTPTRLRQLWDRSDNGNASDTSSSSQRRRRRSDLGFGEDSSSSLLDPLHLGRVAAPSRNNNNNNNTVKCLHMSLTKCDLLLADLDDDGADDESVTDTSRRDAAEEERWLYAKPPPSLQQPGNSSSGGRRKARSVSAQRRLPFFGSLPPTESDVSESEQSSNSNSTGSFRLRWRSLSRGRRAPADSGKEEEAAASSSKSTECVPSSGSTVVTAASSSTGSVHRKSCLKQQRRRQRGRTRNNNSSSSKSSSKKRTGPPKKKLSFAPDDSLVVVVVHQVAPTVPLDDNPDEEPGEEAGKTEAADSLLWYNERELRAMKEAHTNRTKAVGQSLLKDPVVTESETEGATAGEGASAAAGPTTTTCADVFKRLYKACCKANSKNSKSSKSHQKAFPVLTPEEEAMVEDYYAGCTETSQREIGLEHTIHRSIHKDTKLRRERLLAAIFSWNAQHCYKQPQTSSTPTKTTTTTITQESHEELRKICERITRPSRLFAGCVAYAQTGAHS